MPFDAFWIPGLDTEFDFDEALAIGDRWLRESRYPGRRIIALHAAKMSSNRRYLEEMATRYEIVAPQTRNHSYGGSHAVLAVWASDQALELAEKLATPGGGVCLIPGTLKETTMWTSRMGTVNLADPDAGPAPGVVFDPAVAGMLDSLLTFDGHNRFHGAEVRSTLFVTCVRWSPLDTGQSRPRFRRTPSRATRPIAEAQSASSNSTRVCSRARGSATTEDAPSRPSDPDPSVLPPVLMCADVRRARRPPPDDQNGGASSPPLAKRRSRSTPAGMPAHVEPRQ